MAKKKAGNVAVPGNEAELAQFIGRLREAKQLVTAKTNRANGRINDIQTVLASDLAPVQAEIDDLVEGIRLCATANRSSLTNGGKVRSLELATGIIGWRLTPPRVEIRGLEKVLDLIKAGRRRLRPFLRFKVEINKEAMLADPAKAETVPGVSIVQDEIFFIKLDEHDVEIEVAKSKLKVRQSA